MDQSFKKAATSSLVDVRLSAPTTMLTFTADWDDTLCAFNARERRYNFELFMFLAERKDEGHRVIFTSGSPKEIIETNLELAVEFGEFDGFDFKSLLECESITKLDIKKLCDAGELNVDVSFDDKEIATQEKISFSPSGIILMNYATPKLEVRIDPAQFSMSVKTPEVMLPLTFADIKAKVFFMLQTQNTSASPAPAPQ